MSVDVAKARAELEWAQSMANYESWAQTYGRALCNDLAAAEARAEQVETAARALCRVLPESEIDIAHFVWGNTNTALVLVARRALAASVEEANE